MLTTFRFRFGFIAAVAIGLAVSTSACGVPVEDTFDEIVDGDPDDASSDDDDDDDEKVESTSEALTASQKSTIRDRIISAGERKLRAPYVFGASTSSTTEFDCSSFVKYLFRTQANVTLPRTANAQSQSSAGRPVSLSNLKKGDVVFFKSTSRPVPVDHVGIYAGGGRILHTYRVGIGVTYSSFASGGYWQRHAVSARDFIR